MTDRKSTLLALADRVQAGEVGYALNFDIARQTDWVEVRSHWHHQKTGERLEDLPDVTRDLNAINALRVRELPSSTIDLFSRKKGSYAVCLPVEGQFGKSGESPTICAAYLSAVLRAIAAKEQGHG